MQSTLLQLYIAFTRLPNATALTLCHSCSCTAIAAVVLCRGSRRHLHQQQAKDSSFWEATGCIVQV